MPRFGRRPRNPEPVESQRLRELTILLYGYADAVWLRNVAELVRPIAGQLLIFASTSFGDEDLAHIQATDPDEFVRLPWAPPRSRPLSYVMRQAAGEWLMWLEPGEAPSPALLRRLPELLHDDRHIRFELPRRWVWPEADTYLDARPWWPDHQPRLLRNIPGLLYVSGLPGATAELPGPGALLMDEALLHVGLISADASARAAAVAQTPEDARWLAPETLEPPPPTHELDAEDRAVVHQLTEPASGEVPPLRGLPKTVSQTAIDAVWEDRALVADPYAVSIEVLEPRSRLLASGTLGHVLIAVENTGGGRWRWAGHTGPTADISYRWLAADGEPVVPDGMRTPLPGPLNPGDRIVVNVNVWPPAASGDYLLEIDLVHEQVRWFDHPVRVAVQVV
jgi:hypothetical protein